MEVSLKPLCFEEIEVGIDIPMLINKVNLLQLLRYSAATWIFFLLHLEKEFAQKKGFKDVNIHASLYGAFLAKMLTEWIGDPGRLRKLGYKVVVMGSPGDTLICKGKVAKKYQEGKENLVDCELRVENQTGMKVASGSATVFLPHKEGICSKDI